MKYFSGALHIPPLGTLAPSSVSTNSFLLPVERGRDMLLAYSLPSPRLPLQG